MFCLFCNLFAVGLFLLAVGFFLLAVGGGQKMPTDFFVGEKSERAGPLPPPSHEVLAKTAQGAYGNPRTRMPLQYLPGRNQGRPRARSLLDEAPKLQKGLDRDLLQRAGARNAS